jgi:hypothetical protein
VAYPRLYRRERRKAGVMASMTTSHAGGERHRTSQAACRNRLHPVRDCNTHLKLALTATQAATQD